MERKTAYNSTYPKGGVLCYKDRFVVKGTFVLLINICGESPALRVAANRQAVKKLLYASLFHLNKLQ
jgi:hypothetical protein